MQETPVGISSVIDPVAEEARIRFGVEYLYPYQRLVIANVLDYASSFREASDHETISAAGETDNPSEHPDRLRQVVLLPTGYGKSLCFQLPALLLAGLTLAIYPLRSLMADQARRLRTRGIPCAVLQGGVPPEDRENALDGIRSGRVRIALANPEILRSGSVLSVLRSVRIDHAVVDEAHCVAEWGDSFRPAYRDLGDLVRYLDPGAVTAFTATASPGILRRTAEVLFGGEPWRLVAGDPDRPNLRYACAPTLS
ncbi:MAG TPA: DEAD/DEAH box helicase, partial [Magnetospirillaceae bacterium]|nr:DEAD/DEAH box helicase [Magnetospirillaceae bacterium]